MNAGAGMGLFICLVVIVIFDIAEKYYTDRRIGYLKDKVDYFNMLYHNMDKLWGDMFDVMKGQQEEIKILKEIIEQPEENKKCCRNCRFYYELNNQSSACLNVNVNNKHKGDSTIYAENRPISFGTIKCVKPNDCCEYYEPKEESNE